MTRKRREYAQTVDPGYTPPPGSRPDITWRVATPQASAAQTQPAKRRVDLGALGCVAIPVVAVAAILVWSSGLYSTSGSSQNSAAARAGREYAVQVESSRHCTRYEEWLEPVVYPPTGQTVLIQKSVCVGDLINEPPPADQVR